MVKIEVDDVGTYHDLQSRHIMHKDVERCSTLRAVAREDAMLPKDRRAEPTERHDPQR
jgi:hypothetical protein